MAPDRKLWVRDGADQLAGGSLRHSWGIEQAEVARAVSPDDPLREQGEEVRSNLGERSRACGEQFVHPSL